MEAKTTMVIGVFVVVVLFVGVLIPVCTEAGTTVIDIDNDGTLCKKIAAGYSDSFDADDVDDGDYLLIGDTVSIQRDGDKLHIFGVGYEAEADAVTLGFTGSKITINGTQLNCAWAFVQDDDGTYRYGEGGSTTSINTVYGVGAYENIYYSIQGASTTVVGAIA